MILKQTSFAHPLGFPLTDFLLDLFEVEIADGERRLAMGRAATDRTARVHDVGSAAALLDRHLRNLIAEAA